MPRMRFPAISFKCVKDTERGFGGVDEIYSYIDRHAESSLALLERLCAQPSISAEGLGLVEMAGLLATAMREYGLEVTLLDTNGGPPLVYGEIRGRPGPTLLFYNHYDVQPVDPLHEWSSPPFEPTRREGSLYARGVSDNKGDLAVRLAAIAALCEVTGDAPLSIKFVVDGEEESGSSHFADTVHANGGRLAADVCMSEATGVGPDRRSHLVLGVKGLLYVELSTCAAEVDVHSAYAGVVPSPCWRLVGALATLKRPDGRVAVEGFYDSVRPLAPQQRAALEAMPDESEVVRRTLALDAFIDDLTGLEWRERLYAAPTCNICGLEAGYAGPGMKTVLPARARAKLDFRLVPEQTPQEVLSQLRSHLDAHGYSDVTIRPVAAHELPVRTALDDPWVDAVASAAEEFYGHRPVVALNAAGTAPMSVLSREVTPSLFFPPGGAGYQGSGAHAPDEHIRIADFTEAIKFTAFMLQRLAENDAQLGTE